MQHQIDKGALGPRVHALTQGIEACVHCGFCLPTCPTYDTLGEEMDSPRGRIFLMKEVLEGTISMQEALDPIDNCLGCDACVTACPSGVEYDHLITAFRTKAEQERPSSLGRRITRRMILGTLPYPNRAKWAFRTGRLAKPLRAILPKNLGSALELLPTSLPPSEILPEYVPARGKSRGRVALLTGCVQQVLAPEINRATLDVLSANGIDTYIPKNQSCCGALALHTGMEKAALKTARTLLRSIPEDVDALITNAAGCGSGIQEYSILFAGEADEAAAQKLSEKTHDIARYLADIGIVAPPPLSENLKVVYHDACHLAHAQQERDAPRSLLQAIPNLELLEPPDWEICCGSAGIYNIEKPELAKTLGQQKVSNLLSTQPDAIALGNIGCMTQIQKHLESCESPPPVWHTVQFLAAAYHTSLDLKS